MSISIAAVRAWLGKVRRWCWRMARKAAHHAWETFKERFRAAFRQATAAWIGDMAIAAQAAIAPTS